MCWYKDVMCTDHVNPHLVRSSSRWPILCTIGLLTVLHFCCMFTICFILLIIKFDSDVVIAAISYTTNHTIVLLYYNSPPSRDSVTHCTPPVCLSRACHKLENKKDLESPKLKIRLPLITCNSRSSFEVSRSKVKVVQCSDKKCAMTSEKKDSQTSHFIQVCNIQHSASPVLRRGTVCRRTFVLHQHSVLSKICSRLIYFFHSFQLST